MTNQVKNCFKVYVKDNKGLKKTQLIQILGMRICVYIYIHVCVYTHIFKQKLYIHIYFKNCHLLSLV